MQIIPRTPTGADILAEAFIRQQEQNNAIRQQMILNRLMKQHEYQQNIEQSRAAYPELFQPSSIPNRYKFLVEKAEPGMEFNATTGEMSFKKPSPDFFTQYLNWKGMERGNGQGNLDITDNKIYRDLTGKEIPSEQAQQDIASGNTGYTISRRDITKSGIKEIIITKPEDLEKSKQFKVKSDFIIDQAKDQLNTVQEVKNGLKYFGTYGQYIPKELVPGTPYFTWKANLEKLLSGKMIDLMTQMKEASKTGATGFGQLSEKEGEILRQASTAIKGGLSPEKALEYLNTMEGLLQKVIGGNQTQLPTGFNPDEWEIVPNGQ